MSPYEIQIWADGKNQPVIPVEDPFHTTTVTLGWDFKDWFWMLLRRKREAQVVVKLTSPKPYVINTVMNALHSDCVRCGTGLTNVHIDHDGDLPEIKRSGMGKSDG